MRLVLWIVVFVGMLAGASYGYYQFLQKNLIARPLYQEEFRQEAALRNDAAMASAPLAPEGAPPEILPIDSLECLHLQNIDWTSLLTQHTWFKGINREDIAPATVWTLKLDLLAFLGMEYDILQIDQLSATSVSYHRLEYSEILEAGSAMETHPFGYFQEKACGLHVVQPLLLASSDLGQVALPLPKQFLDLFMNDPDFRSRLGQRINKRYRMDVNRRQWTPEDILRLAEQP